MIAMNQGKHYDPNNKLGCYHFKQSMPSFPGICLSMILHADLLTFNK